MKSMYPSNPLRSTLNPNVVTGLDMCKVCTQAVSSSPLRSALNTNVIMGLDMRKVYTTQAVHCQHLEDERFHRFGHVKSMYGSSPLRSTLNTNVITGLDMCKVCTDAT